METSQKNRKDLLSRLFVSGLLFLALVHLLYREGPQIWHRFQSEGGAGPLLQVETLDGELFDLNLHKGPALIIFWATWCAPCELELSRINRLIEWGTLDPKNVIAISSLESPDLVRDTVKNRHYLFKVGMDQSGFLLIKYQVRTTPTILLIDAEKQVQWFTSGVSPSLELRISNFFK